MKMGIKMDFLNELKKILIRNTQNRDVQKNDWEKVEYNLGFSLPKDYKDFIDYYGTGGVNNFFWLHTPFTNVGHMNFEKHGQLMLETYQHVKELYPELYIHEIYPNKNGILPIGYTDNGDEIYWKTNDETSLWQIIVYDNLGERIIEYPMGMAEWIYRLVSKEINCEIFPDDFIQGTISYYN